MAPEMMAQSSSKDGRYTTVFFAFMFLWAIQVLFHQAKPALWAFSTKDAILSFFAFLLIMNPLSFRVAIGLLVVETWVILIDLPGKVTNHWIFVSFIDLILLSTITRLSFSKRRFPTASEIVDFSGNTVRLAVIMLYFFVVLHKLNFGFFNPDVSCAADHYMKLAEKFPFLPVTGAVRAQIIAVTLLFEMGIPILLIFEKSRFLGVISAIFFHTVVGINNFFDFSTMLFAILTFFIPAEAPLFTKFDEMASTVPRTRTYFFISAVCSMILVILASRYRFPLSRAFIFVGVLYAGGLCLLALKDIKAFRSRRNHEMLGFRPRLSTHYLFLSLMALNGSAPYLGLQTNSVFSMFSNLRTEEGKTNHLFIPASTQIFDYQRELVEVIDDQNRNRQLSPSPDPIGYVHLHFTGLVKQVATTSRSFQPVTYSYKGETQKVSSLKDVDDLFDSYSRIERKLLKFRGVRIGAVKCDH